MKRFRVLVLCLILTSCTVLTFGCGKKDNDEFFEVCSIAYEVAGISNTVIATYSIKEDEDFHRSITKEEFLISPEEDRLYSINFNSKFAINKDKQNIPKLVIGKEYFYSKSYWSYYHVKIKEIKIYIPQIKIIDSNKLEIMNEDGSITSVQTTSYAIEYFIL